MLRQWILVALVLLAAVFSYAQTDFTVTQLDTDRTSYQAGDTITVTYNAPSHTASNWIYLVAVDPTNGCSGPDDTSDQCENAVFNSQYINVPDTDSGTVTLTATPVDGAVNNQYFVRYRDESTGFLTKRSTGIITIGGTATSSSSSSSTGPAESSSSSSTGVVVPPESSSSSSTGVEESSSSSSSSTGVEESSSSSSSSTGVESSSSSTGTSIPTIIDPVFDYVPSILFVGDAIPVTFQLPTQHNADDFIGLYDANNQTCIPTDDTSCWTAMRLVDDVVSRGNFYNGSYIIYFDGLNDRNTTLFVRYVSQQNQLIRSNDILYTAQARLFVPAAAVVSQMFPVSFQAPLFHSVDDYIAGYLVQNDVISDTAVLRKNVPAGRSGWVLFNMSEITEAPENIQAIVFRYHLQNDAVVSDDQFWVNLFSRAGVCHQNCTNAGFNCTAANQCGDCGSITGDAQCVDAPTPVLSVTGLLNDSLLIATIDQESTLSFVVSGLSQNMVAGTTILVDHLPNNAVLNNQSMKLNPSTTDAGRTEIVRAIAITPSGKISNVVTVTILITGETCFAWGDPHITTFDGRAYDFQGVGDFVVAGSFGFGNIPKNFSAQARFLECGQGVSCLRGVALMNANDSIAMLFDNNRLNVTVNNVSIPLVWNVIQQQFSWSQDLLVWNNSNVVVIPLDREGMVTQNMLTGLYEADNVVGWLSVQYSRFGMLQLVLRDLYGASFIVNAPQNARPSWLLSVPRDPFWNTLYGLCGWYNGNNNDEFVVRRAVDSTSQVTIPQLDISSVQPTVLYDGFYNYTLLNDNTVAQDIYSVFGLSWRVATVERVFNYTALAFNVVNRDIPVSQVLFNATVSQQLLQEYSTICSAFDLTTQLRQQCVFEISKENNVSIALRNMLPGAMGLCLRTNSCPQTLTNLRNCQNMCSFRGVCRDNNVCECISNWNGTDCSNFAPVAVTSSSSSTGVNGGSSSTGSVSSSTGSISSSTGPAGPAGPSPDAGAAAPISFSWHLVFYTVFMASVLCFALLA